MCKAACQRLEAERHSLQLQLAERKQAIEELRTERSGAHLLQVCREALHAVARHPPPLRCAEAPGKGREWGSLRTGTPLLRSPHAFWANTCAVPAVW